ncbi:hypothetical protein BST27_19555 [Mycobacterium intermedium]|uniref:Uncharacterized protein n=1 Tax=Mycobacterium intermedium TaxID=28445 RepID=A0A1E3S860_MYCIE|nr:hypothetical protein [Mycobacterium intermedium]MCV6962266.1 hypothetical protein [Mycobacterium intermedium]ODQ97767.1 hypothetical protein BHQ20_25105 [Mycobacterium intermedium]OPE49659.1 hypothetical protein BV508_13440 [Mycobacterium intermedium]ORA99293.1 hypothetical protein BST27_19555 [Mycobacterium intermedium]
MDEEARSAVAPRWRGKAGRLEVWYATLSDPVTRAGLWVHYETVAPTAGAPYAHGWATYFPADGTPRTERFGPAATQPATGAAWFDNAGGRVAPEEMTGRARSLAWNLSWKDTGAPLWTFPRVAWERELLPGAQVVLAPTADFAGSLTVDDTTHSVDGWRGGVAHIYGHGNAKRWGWIHADLGNGDVVEAVTAVSHKPGLNRLAPLAFVRFRIDGKDWPASPLPSLRMRTTLGVRHWQLEGRIGRRQVLIRVDQPPERCVSLQYTDPDGGTVVCTNTEQADIHVEIDDRQWSVLGTGHAEVGLRGPDAPPVNERTLNEDVKPPTV